MDDYVYLEEMGRKVEGWGKEIGRGGYAAGAGAGAGGGRGGRGGFDNGGRGGGGRGGRGGGAQRTKRDILKMQLEARDVDVEMLPAGMERRSLNQSTWDFKYACFFVFIQTTCAYSNDGYFFRRCMIEIRPRS